MSTFAFKIILSFIRLALHYFNVHIFGFFYILFVPWIKALKEAFEVFCNKGVAGSSSAELLATFCDNILKKGGSEKMSDEAIEETLEKVSCVLHTLSLLQLYNLMLLFYLVGSKVVGIHK